MPLDTSGTPDLDTMEFDAWAKGVGEVVHFRDKQYEWVETWHGDLRSQSPVRKKSGLDSLRHHAREHLLIEGVQTIYPRPDAGRPPFARIGRHVVTGIAVAYYDALRQYHRALEKGSEGGDIETIRQDLGQRYALLLRQFNEIILPADPGSFETSPKRIDRRCYNGQTEVEDRIRKTVDADRLREATRFWIGLDRVNHFEGITATSRTPIARINGFSSGIDSVDFLRFLNDDEAVGIYYGESNFSEETLIAVLHTDGVVEMKGRGEITYG